MSDLLPAPGPAVQQAAAALVTAAEAARPRWTPRPELAVFTHTLLAGNLALIAHREHGIDQLLAAFMPPRPPTPQTIASAVTLLGLPYIRIPKRLRVCLLSRPFVTAARALNRKLMQVKVDVGHRLRGISNELSLGPEICRLAAAACARTPLCPLHPDELNDVEIPKQILPPDSPVTLAPAATPPQPTAQPTTPPTPVATPPAPTAMSPTAAPSTHPTPPSRPTPAASATATSTTATPTAPTGHHLPLPMPAVTPTHSNNPARFTDPPQAA
jgi:hypothetical protein